MKRNTKLDRQSLRNNTAFITTDLAERWEALLPEICNAAARTESDTTAFGDAASQGERLPSPAQNAAEGSLDLELCKFLLSQCFGWEDVLRLATIGPWAWRLVPLLLQNCRRLNGTAHGGWDLRSNTKGGWDLVGHRGLLGVCKLGPLHAAQDSSRGSHDCSTADAPQLGWRLGQPAIAAAYELLQVARSKYRDLVQLRWDFQTRLKTEECQSSMVEAGLPGAVARQIEDVLHAMPWSREKVLEEVHARLRGEQRPWASCSLSGWGEIVAAGEHLVDLMDGRGFHLHCSGFRIEFKPAAGPELEITNPGHTDPPSDHKRTAPDDPENNPDSAKPPIDPFDL